MEAVVKEKDAIIHRLTAANARLSTALVESEDKVRKLQRRLVTLEVSDSHCDGSRCGPTRTAKAKGRSALVIATASRANAEMREADAQAAAEASSARAKAAAAGEAAAVRANAALKVTLDEVVRDLDAFKVLCAHTLELHGKDVVVEVMAENAMLKDLMAGMEAQIEGLAADVAKAKASRNATLTRGPAAVAQEIIDEADRVPGLVAQLAEVDARRAAAESLNARLRVELAAFDPEFFAQLGAVKRNHEAALELLHDYRHWLLLISRKYGVALPERVLRPPLGLTLPPVTDDGPDPYPPRRTLRHARRLRA